MILILQNQTANVKTYASGAVTLSANGSVTVLQANQLATAVDGNLFADVTQNNVWISDNVNVFKVADAVNYLNRLISTQISITDENGNGINSNNGQLQVRDVINTAGQNRAQSITTSAAEALGAATILTNRKFVSMTPTNGTIYWGFTSGVTTSTGTPIFKNQTITIAVTDNVHIFVISAGTVDCRIAEGS